MNRVKCIIRNKTTEEEYRYVIVIKDTIRTIDKFAQYVLNEYIHIQNNYSYTVLLDGFEIQKQEDISIFHQDDIITIEYIEKEKQKEKKKKKEIKKSNKKQKEKAEKKETKELKLVQPVQPVQPVFEKQHVNDKNDGFSYPENKITIFEEDKEYEEPPLLRILPKQVYSGGNTNTPTVNKKEDRKKIRRGKRGGRKNQCIMESELPNQLEIKTVDDSIISQKNIEENMKEDHHQHDELQESSSPIQNQSYLDYIVQEQPSVIMNSVIQMKEESQEKDDEPVEKNENNHINSTNHQLPHIGDELHFPYVVLNYDTFSPESKEISGIVKNITSNEILLYSKEIDDMIHMSFEDYQNLHHFFVCY